MASGAALRAMAISALRSGSRYWSSGAILGYGTLASCACARHAVLSTTTSTKLPTAIVLTILLFIDFPLRYGLKYAFKPMMRQSQTDRCTFIPVCMLAESNTTCALGRTHHLLLAQSRRDCTTVFTKHVATLTKAAG